MAEMGWGNVKVGGTGEGTPFMRLDSGDNKVRVVGLPFQVDLHWEKGLDQQNKKIVCPGFGCPICKKGHVPMSRYQVLVIDRKDAKVKILEGGPRIFSSIKEYAMDPEYGDPSKYDLKIKKEGSGRETKYTVLASPNKSNLTADEQNAVNTSKSLTDINKPKSVEEILQMGLECLADSISGLDDEWGASATGGAASTPSGSAGGNDSLEISDDDWNVL